MLDIKKIKVTKIARNEFLIFANKIVIYKKHCIEIHNNKNTMFQVGKDKKITNRRLKKKTRYLCFVLVRVVPGNSLATCGRPSTALIAIDRSRMLILDLVVFIQIYLLD